MKRYLAINTLSFSRELSSRLAYRVDFSMSVVAMTFLQITVPLAILILYGASEGFAGWNVYQALLLTSYAALVHALGHVFVLGVMWGTIHRVRDGRFDLFLLAPMHPLAYLIARSPDIEDIGKIASSLAITLYAALKAHITLGQAALLMLYIPIGLLVFAGIGILMSAITIKFISTWRVYEVLGLLENISKYPLTIFPVALQVVFLVLIPVGVISYLPVSTFIGTGISLLVLGAVFAGLFVTLSIYVWNRALRSYMSAGG